MRETPAGLLVAYVDAENCSECGACVSVCPGLAVPSVCAADQAADPFAGPVVSASLGEALRPEVRRAGQSGGLARALLEHLFAAGQITGAVSVVMPDDGSLRPEARIVRHVDELVGSQGSKYCPVAVNAVLGEVWADDRLAIVGLPCHLHGVAKLLSAGAMTPEQVLVRIGLVCDRVMSYAAIDRMAADMGVDLAQAASLQYRSKDRAGWPGEVSFILRDGERIFGSAQIRRRIKEYVTPGRCRLCFDKLNTSADVTLGDAWGLGETRLGRSLALARTNAGAELLADAAAAGSISLEDVDPSAAFYATGLVALKRRFVAFAVARRAAGGVLPEYGGLLSAAGPASALDLWRARRLLELGDWVSAAQTRAEVVERIDLARVADRNRRLLAATLARVASRWARPLG
jgi:coenzyme F420 hydrogenase subunit beta